MVAREVVNGVMYVLSTGCQWRYIPKDLPPRSTVDDYLTRWNDDGTIEKIHYALYVQCREAFGREDHVRQRGGNSGLAEVAAGHAATVENWVAIASVNGGISSAIASVCM